MLDCAHSIAGIVAYNRAQREVLDVLHVGGNVGDNPAALRHQEAEASIGFCWMQRDRYWRSTVHPRACELDLARNRSLPRADEPIRHVCRPSMSAPAMVVTSQPRRPATPGRDAYLKSIFLSPRALPGA